MNNPSFSFLWTHFTANEKQSMAVFCNTDKSYLGKIAHGHQMPSEGLMQKMTRFDSRITRSSVWL